MPESSDPQMDEVDPELFERGVYGLIAALKILRELKGEAEDLADGPLTHADTVALLYGRRNSLNKTEVKNGFEAVERVGSASEEELLTNVVADYSDLNKTEAGTFVEELYDLRRKYGEGEEDDD